MKKPKKDTPKGDGTTMLGEHRVATANGCCTIDCPACVRTDRLAELFPWLLAGVIVLGLILRCP